MDPMIGHRLRATLPAPTGSPALAVCGYGLDERMRPSLIDRPRGTDDWLLMGFATSARLWVESAAGGVERELDAGALVLWRPQAPHRYGHPTRPWRHSWVHLDGELLRTRAATLGLPLETPIAGVPIAWLDACITGLHEEITSQGLPDGEILAAHLDILLRRAARVANGDRMVPAGLLAARTHIEARFGQPLRLAALARLAGYSIPHFCAGFRKHFAISPIDLAIRLRLAQARRLMSERGMTVADAARQVGYADYRHLTRLFRRRYGHPPRACRID